MTQTLPTASQSSLPSSLAAAGCWAGAGVTSRGWGHGEGTQQPRGDQSGPTRGPSLHSTLYLYPGDSLAGSKPLGKLLRAAGVPPLLHAPCNFLPGEGRWAGMTRCQARKQPWGAQCLHPAHPHLPPDAGTWGRCEPNTPRRAPPPAPTTVPLHSIGELLTLAPGNHLSPLHPDAGTPGSLP